MPYKRSRATILAMIPYDRFQLLLRPTSSSATYRRLHAQCAPHLPPLPSPTQLFRHQLIFGGGGGTKTSSAEKQTKPYHHRHHAEDSRSASSTTGRTATPAGESTCSTEATRPRFPPAASSENSEEGGGSNDRSDSGSLGSLREAAEGTSGREVRPRGSRQKGGSGGDFSVSLELGPDDVFGGGSGGGTSVLAVGGKLLSRWVGEASPQCVPREILARLVQRSGYLPDHRTMSRDGGQHVQRRCRCFDVHGPP